MIIAFISDFGEEDHYAGAMKGAALAKDPGAKIIDITHDIRKFDILHGAYVTAAASRAFPEGTIFVVVVDPGVGSGRRALIVRCGGKYYVAPDNGVLSLVWGEGCRAWEVDMTLFPRADPTFHGRDVFAPVAGMLSSGAEPDEIGRPLDSIRLLDIGFGRCVGKRCHGEVLHIDSFGNVISNIRERPPFDLGSEVTVSVGPWRARVRFLRTYAEARRGDPLVLVNSEGFLELSVREGSAASLTRARVGQSFSVEAR